MPGGGGPWGHDRGGLSQDQSLSCFLQGVGVRGNAGAECVQRWLPPSHQPPDEAQPSPAGYWMSVEASQGVINELREPEGHQLLLWHVCSHPDVGLLQPKSHRHWPRQSRTCRNDDYCSHLGGWQSAFPISSSGILSLYYASGSAGKFIKMQIPGSGADLFPRSGSVPLR